MVTLEYVNAVSGEMNTMHITADVLEMVLSVMIKEGIVIQSIIYNISRNQ